MSTTAISSASYTSGIQANEAVTYIPGAMAVNIPHGELSKSVQNLGASSSPPVAKVSVFTVTLTAGAATVNLFTGLKDGAGNTITPTGLSLRMLKVQNPNANAVAIVPDGTHGYAGLTLTVPPYGEATIFDSGAGGATPSYAAITSTNAVVDFNGTAAQAFNVTVWLG